jgi:hypothetical protein
MTCCCLVDGKPVQQGTKLDFSNLMFVGMESEPNRAHRYGALWHSWHNLPCYETKKRTKDEDKET